MWKTASIACSTCQNHDHCADCRAYFKSVSYKNMDLNTKYKLTTPYIRISNHAHSSPVDKHTMCTDCSSEACHTCSMYNTKFVTE